MSPENSCIFCKIAAGQVASKTVYQDDHVMAFRDVNPQAPVHILVIPKKHIESLHTLRDDDGALVSLIHGAIRKVAAAEKLGENGYRVVTNIGQDGGQSVAHLHYHVLGGRAMKWPPG
jgi:histidine triad (HIT) family protein